MKKSAGILLFRRRKEQVQVFLVHPGGPFWKGKEAGAWSVPKGEFEEGEAPLEAARREFREETGQEVEGSFIPLSPIRQKGGKLVHTWAVEGDINADEIRSNTFRQEWPYKSGQWQEFPEVDKAAWFEWEDAKTMINPAQAGLIDELRERLQSSG
jgi:predicted NUDIX family NTP pyrophosphohydrolase